MKISKVSRKKCLPRPRIPTGLRLRESRARASLSFLPPSPGRRPGYPWCAARRSLPQENLVSRKSFPPQQTDARGAWNVVNHGQDSVSSFVSPSSLRYSARFSNRPRFIKNCTVHAFFSMSWFRFRDRVVRESLFEERWLSSCKRGREGGRVVLQSVKRVKSVEIRFLLSFLFVLFVCYLEVQIYLNYLFNFDTGLIVDRIFLGNSSRFRFLKLCMNTYVG